MRFKTREELEKFKDRAISCVCGRLMTGLHMSGCTRLKKIEEGLKND